MMALLLVHHIPLVRLALELVLLIDTIHIVEINYLINCNRSVDIPKYTTLNEHFNVLADESIGKKNGKDFQLAYFGIGIGGSRSIGEDSFGLEDRKVNQHKATDFNAFHGIPLIARELHPEVP
ncbi:hypothetical protein AP1_0472 [Aeromonas phage AP1]|nr:hypothetical protein AP1_0472 [Aeromonas phage AP1]